MHTDFAWQRMIDRQDHLRRDARSWRLCARHSEIDPAQLVHHEHPDHVLR
jgi:hypothetical protein